MVFPRVRKPGVVAAVLFAAATLVMPHPVAAAPDYVALPLLLRLEGVGPIYGAAGGARDALGDRGDLYAGATGGAVEGLGALAADLPLGAEPLGLSLFAVAVTRAEFDTAYRRGITDDRAIRQEVSGHAYGALVNARYLDDRLGLTLGLAQSTVVLEDFRDGDDRAIPLPDAHLTDIDTTHAIAAVAYDSTGGAARPRDGFRLGLNGVTASGRTGQSDTLTTSYRATGFLGLGASLTGALHAFGSDASVLRRESRYDTEAEVRDELAIDCAQVADDRKRQQCERLEAELAAYIAANNRFGTATPLGGSTTLRAYRELRYRAAHTRLIATELRWGVSETFGWAALQREGYGLELVPFAEAGYAADTAGALYDTVRTSYGLALRLFLAGLPIRLAAAHGQEGTAWFLTAGSAW